MMSFHIPSICFIFSLNLNVFLLVCLYVNNVVSSFLPSSPKLLFFLPLPFTYPLLQHTNKIKTLLYDSNFDLNSVSTVIK